MLNLTGKVRVVSDLLKMIDNGCARLLLVLLTNKFGMPSGPPCLFSSSLERRVSTSSGETFEIHWPHQRYRRLTDFNDLCRLTGSSCQTFRLGRSDAVVCQFIWVGIGSTLALRKRPEKFNVSRFVVLEINKIILVACVNHQFRTGAKVGVEQMSCLIIGSLPSSPRARNDHFSERNLQNCNSVTLLVRFSVR